MKKAARAEGHQGDHADLTKTERRNGVTGKMEMKEVGTHQRAPCGKKKKKRKELFHSLNCVNKPSNRRLFSIEEGERDPDLANGQAAEVKGRSHRQLMARKRGVEGTKKKQRKE